jgi:SAM-dependent methyltransferase
MPFPDSSFDVVIANHVLEHVADDQQAVREIFRVLTPGGRAVLQTPFSPVLTRTIQDEGVDTPSARLALYGQEDHVRLYGADIVERFTSSGLESRVVEHASVLSSFDPDIYGVNPSEPLLLFQRPFF